MASKRNVRKARWEDMDKSKTGLSLLAQHFEVHNRTEGKSPRTVEWYNLVLKLLMRWLGEQGKACTIGDIGETEIREFILYLQEKPGRNGPASTHTIANRVRALRAFFGWVHRKGYTETHILQDMRNPKTKEQVIEPLTQEEIGRVFAAINPRTALGSRNTALVSLMLDTGLRLTEVATLKDADVHLDDRYVKVLGKGSKERFVAFGQACLRSLLDYCHHFRTEAAHPGVDTFFRTIDGYPMTPEAIKSMVERLAVASGVKRLHPHLLRHTYATSFLTNGGDIFLLKQNLGHSTLVMVTHYVHIASRNAAVLSQGFSPLDRLEVKGSRRYSHGLRRGEPEGVYPQAGIGRRR